MNQESPKFDVPYGGILDAILLYPAMVALCTIVLAAAGVALGYMREPTYTATSELLVGNLSISDPSAIPGAVGASQALADVYARLIDANDVRRRIAKETETAPDEASVSATHVIESPLIEVTATSDSQQAAVNYANAGGAALSDYVNGLKSPGAEVKPIARRYREAQLRYAQARDLFERLERRLGPSFTPAERAQLNEAESDLETAQLRRRALGALFQRGQSIRVSQPSLSLFETATGTSSDRASTMQITGLIGLIAGLALGAALAVFRAGRLVKEPR